MTPESLVNVVEAGLLAAGRALTLDDLLALFIGSSDAPDRNQLRDALAQLDQDLSGRGIELVEVASGYRLQVRKEYSSWLAGLFSERPPRYSRALLETLALITYRQPITRGEIEDIRGVAVSSNIIKTLMEREWIRVLGHREVPGRPALYGTTREFLDHFGLKNLEGLPPLADIRDLDQVAPDLFAPAAPDVEVCASQNGEDEPSPSRSEAKPGKDASAGVEDHGDGSVAEDVTDVDAMPDESAVNESEPHETQVVEAAESVELGGGDLNTRADENASPAVGQSNDTDDAIDVAGEDDDSERVLSNDEGVDDDVKPADGGLDTGLDDDASLVVGQSSDTDGTDDVVLEDGPSEDDPDEGDLDEGDPNEGGPNEGGDSETSSSINATADANDAAVVLRSDDEDANDQDDQDESVDESVSEHLDQPDLGEHNGRR